MSRTIFYIIVLISTAISCKNVPIANAGDTIQKPNIIFIMSDDQGYADLGCYGSKDLHTPYIDRMAKEGMVFSQAYAGSPVCAPARCVLMTGLHSGHATRRDNRTTFDIAKAFMNRQLIPLKDEDVTVAELMKKAGYVTAGFGKWGLGNLGTTGEPGKQGFDEFFGYYDQVHAHDYYTEYLMHNQDTFSIEENRNNKKGIYTHDLIAKKAMDFIKKNQENPFFLYLPFTLPHGKYVVPDNSKYANTEWSEKVKNYAAMITHLDEDVGEILSLLKELNLDKNTIVFFTSDNGPNPPFLKDLKSNQPFRGVKRQLLEGGIRVPMIVRWPGKIPAGTQRDFAWGFWDVMPTLAEITGIEIPKGIDGISILPTLMGKVQLPKEFLYWEYYSPFQQAVRMGKWKGIRFGTREKVHLFDLSLDHQERHDISNDFPKVVDKIAEIMDKEHTANKYWPAEEKASKSAEVILNP